MYPAAANIASPSDNACTGLYLLPVHHEFVDDLQNLPTNKKISSCHGGINNG